MNCPLTILCKIARPNDEVGKVSHAYLKKYTAITRNPNINR